MNTLLQGLAEVCRTRLLDEKHLLAPSKRVAVQWLDGLARASVPVVNVRVHTPRSLALNLAEGGMLRDGLTYAGGAARALAVSAAWERAVRGTGSGSGYLGATTVTPRLLALAGRTIGDLRLAGITSAALPASRFEVADKGHQIRAILKEYEDELSRRRLLDAAGVIRLAAEAVRKRRGTPGAWPLLLVPDGLRLSKIEREMIDGFPAERVVRLPVDEPRRADVPRREDEPRRARRGEPAGLFDHLEAVPPRGGGAPPSDLGLLAWLHAPEAAPPPRRDGTVRIVHAVGEVNEVRAALRTILAEGLRLDEVEFLYSDSGTYVELLYEVARRVMERDPSLDLGVSLTFAEGVPARVSRPGRLLERWLRWIEDDFPQAALVEIVREGLLRAPAGGRGRPPGAGRLARLLGEARIGFGRERYLPRLDRPAAGEGGPAWRAETARALRALVGNLLEVTPAEDAAPLAVVECARALVSGQARCANRLDRLARQHLRRELDEMAFALRGAGAPPFDIRTWLGELPARLRVAGSSPRPGHLHAAPLRAGGHSARPFTWIAGLDDARFPPAGMQDPLLLDDERCRIGALPSSADRAGEELQAFRRLLCGLRGRLAMSFSCRNLGDNRESFAGSVILSAFRIATGRHDGDYGDLREWLGPPASFAPTEETHCLDAAEWWMCRGAGDPAPSNLGDLADAAFPHLARGREAARARASDRFGAHDGVVEAPGTVLDPSAPDGPWLSASRLETLGACPLRYFYRYILRLRPPEEIEPDPERWLDPLAFGNLLHEVFHEFVGELVAAGTWPPRGDRDRVRLEAILDAAIERYRDEHPPPGPDAFERQRDDLERAAAIFLAGQGRTGGIRPVYLEASIGLPSSGAGTPIDRREPVPIRLPGGATVRMSARFDRIDREGEGDGASLRVLDYKTGRLRDEYLEGDGFDQGRRLQHAIYLAVAREVLGARVDRFEFLFVNPAARGRTVRHLPRIVEDGLGLVETFCRLAAAGVFPATTDEKDCSWCDYAGACRAVDRDLSDLCERSRSKIAAAAPQSPALRAFGELRGVK